MENLVVADIVVDVCKIVGLACTIFGGMFALIQWADRVRQTRVEMVDRLLASFLDESVRGFFYDFIDNENGDKWYEDRFSKDCEESLIFEKQVDSFLGLFDKLCYWYFAGVISDAEANIFGYHLARLLDNEQVKKYLLDLEYRKQKCKSNPFTNLVLYGTWIGINGKPFSCYKIRFLWKVRRKVLRWINCLFSPVGHATVGVDLAECSALLQNEEKLSTHSVDLTNCKPSEFVRNEFLDFIRERCKNDEEQLRNLCDRQYCKTTFGCIFPVLIEEDKITQELYRRYYVDGVSVNGVVYRLCNHWYKMNVPKIVKWMSEQKKGVGRK